MPHVICEPCVGAKTGECTLVCPADCIYDAGDQYVIDLAACIDCGACADVCPMQAIRAIDEVPAHWQRFITKNADYFYALVE